MAVDYTCSTCFKPSGTGKGCIPIDTPSCDKYFAKNAIGARSTNFPQIAAAWIANNNANAVRGILVSTGLVANMAVANSMSRKQLSDTLYNYYLTSGRVNYAKLLAQIPVNNNISSSEASTLAQATTDIGIASGRNMGNADISVSRVDDAVAKTWWEEVIGVVLGGSETTTEPVITTTTKISPLAIGFAIAGVLVLGIIAWVIVKK